ncbi:type VII secretion system-associated protein [Streptomyces sp. BBFR51]|uniref:type VII secretion system-associated protein n=1 Tax=Streptomyces sp. BBFR51 TaxID=3372856 RepID=UPI0037DDA73D
MGEELLPVEQLPEVPPQIQEAARVAPDHWFGIVDPAWRGEEAPPNWAVVGQYRSDADGKVVAWQDNPEYRPSPSANGWPDPTDPVDEAIQLAATGYGPEEDVFRLLAGAEVGVLLTPDGSPVAACSPDGGAVVPVFTSDAQLRAQGRYAGRTLAVQDLVRDLGENLKLYVNPAGPVSMSVAPEQLAAVSEQPADVGAGEPPDEARHLQEPEQEPDLGREAVGESEPEPGPVVESEPESGAEPEENTGEKHESGGGATIASTQDYLVNVLSGGAG